MPVTFKCAGCGNVWVRGNTLCERCRSSQADPSDDAPYIDIVFDGPPAHESGRFIEVESPAGKGVHVGEWIDRGDGYWALRIPRASSDDAMAVLRELYKYAEHYEGCDAYFGSGPCDCGLMAVLERARRITAKGGE